jgi:hypothetical protein
VSAAAERYSARKSVASGSPERGPRPDCIAFMFVFLARIITCGAYKLTLSDQVQITQQPRIRFLRFSVKIFNRSALAREAQQFFHRGPNPLSAAPMICKTFLEKGYKGSRTKKNLGVLGLTGTYRTSSTTRRGIEPPSG